LFEYEADEVAKLYDIPTVRAGLAETEKRALLLARKIGFPIVMKIVSPDIIHKTDAGGVVVGINSTSDVRKAFRDIIKNVKKAKKNADIKGIYVQRMAPKTQEFVAGGTRDPQFGPTVMFGLGGIYVELYKDVSFRLAPLSDEEALGMMQEIKAAPLLTGFRGSKPLDMKACAGVIRAVGRMMDEIKQIDSVDINPLLVYEKGSKAVDVRIILVSGNPAPQP
jgi:acetate---CoA ligase (ADP-forming) subunit beta